MKMKKYYITNEAEPVITGFEETYEAENPEEALCSYLEDRTVGDLLEYGDDETYEAVPEDMLEEDQSRLGEIDGFSWHFHDNCCEILHNGEVVVAFHAIDTRDTGTAVGEKQDENSRWYFDETCNWKVGANDGWN